MQKQTKPRLALVEDNDDLREELVSELEYEGYSIWGVNSAEAFYKRLLSSQADIALVDLTLPGEDGLELVQYLSEHSCRGIIVVTARGDRENRMQGVLKGADHYLIKPVDIDELKVAITALWRRLQQRRNTAPRHDADKAVNPGWHLDSSGRALQCGPGRQLILSEKESLFIKALLARENQVVGKEELHVAVFGQPCEHEHDVHRIEVITSRIRRKAREQGIDLPIRAVFGRGLVFTNEADENS